MTTSGAGMDPGVIYTLDSTAGQEPRITWHGSVGEGLPSASPVLQADTAAISQMIAGSGPLSGRTLFKEVKRLQPGQELVKGPGGTYLQTSDNWFNTEPKTSEIDGLLEAIEGAVLQLDATLPVVSLLSGGWDSRLLLAMILHSKKFTNIRALTTSSDTGTIMEELIATRVAHELGVEHELVFPSVSEFGNDLGFFAESVDYLTSFHVWLVPIVRALGALTQESASGRLDVARVKEIPQVVDGLGGGLFVGGAFPDHETPSLSEWRLGQATRYLSGAQGLLRTQVIET